MRNRIKAALIAGVFALCGSMLLFGNASAQDEINSGSLVSLRGDNGEALTALVPVTEEEEKEQKALENGDVIPDRFLENLADYIPEGGEELLPAGVREQFTGIDPLTPSEGDVKALVLICEFADCGYTDEFKNNLKGRLFANDPEWAATPEGAEESVSTSRYYPMDSLRGYYQRSSFGKLRLSGEFAEFRSEHARSYYDRGEGDDNAELYLDAVNSWVKSVVSENDGKDGKTDLEFLDEKLKEFDLDGDMIIDSCYLACAGGNTGWGTRWWSYRTASKIRIGSYRLTSLVQVVDSLSEEGVVGKDDLGDYIVTWIHETGHYLGLVDYYSYDPFDSDAKIMTSSMMGNNYLDQDGFAKMLLGWIPKEKVWVVTDKQVYNPGTKQWEDHSGSCTLALEPYAEKGDLALVIPKRNDSEDWNWVFDQFIMVEHYKSSANDTLKDYTRNEAGEAVTVPPTEGLRLFRIYGKLNAEKDSFIAENISDSKIPLISDYNNPADPYMVNSKRRLGVYRPGVTPAEELTPVTDPPSLFYSNPSNDGLLSNSELIDSGISITNIRSMEDGRISFDTGIADTSDQGPRIADDAVPVTRDQENGAYVRVRFDRPVNYIGGKESVIYDYDPDSNTFIQEEKWGTVSEVRRSPSGNKYLRETRELYFMLDGDKARYTEGVLVIPPGVVSSETGQVSGELICRVNGVPEGSSTLSVSCLPGLYGEKQETEIYGAPAGSKIHYTMDGSEPTQESMLYEGKLSLDSSVVLKALAIDENGSVASRRLRAEYVLEKVSFPGKDDPTEKDITLDVGEAFYLKPVIWPSKDRNTSLRYKSSDPKVATVDRNGVVIAVNEGNAEILVSTDNTVNAPAKCRVKVMKGSASSVREKVTEAYGIKEAGFVMRTISEALGGRVTLQEFAGDKNYMEGLWIADIKDQTYSSKALKPEITVYKGVRKLAAGDYKVSYKKNKNAGEAVVTVKFKGEYKENKPFTAGFTINPASLDNELIVLDTGVKYNGRTQKPKPVILWKSTGKKQAFSKANFNLSFTDGSGGAIDGVKDEGGYTAYVYGTGKNFTGSAKMNIRVQKTDLLEKVSVKVITKNYAYRDGLAVLPVYGEDYQIRLPKGYTGLGDDPFKKGVLKATYLNNIERGKMAMVISAADGGTYAGSKVVYLNIR